MREYLCTSQNGERVFADVEHTNMPVHILENANLLELIKEAVEQSELVGEKVVLEVDLGRIVGTTSMVEVTDSDDIIYAKRIGRDKYSKFVKDHELRQTSKVVAVLFRESDGYLLWSGWCGELLPQEPDGKGGSHTSRAFDATHALVYDPKIIQMDTLTRTLPC